MNTLSIHLAFLALLPAMSCSAPSTVPRDSLIAPQEPAVDSHALLRTKLASDEAAVRAWGAWEAGEIGARELAPDVVAAMRRAVASREHDPRAFELRSELDALVRLDARLVTDDVAELSRIGGLRTQALVLASREPQRHVEALASMRSGSRDLERVAIDNLLATGAPKRAVELLLPAARVRVVVHVSDGQGGSFSGSRRGGIGCGSLKAPEGFPPTVLYHLAEGDSSATTAFADGPRPIGYVRTVRHEREFGIGGTFAELDEAQHALRLLRWIAHDHARESVLSSTVEVRHGWVDAATYLDALKREIEPRERAWRMLVDSLVKDGHLEVERVPAKPPIEIVVEDERADRSVAIPPWNG